MVLPWTFVEHDILQLDADHGITYQSFEEFWEKRMEPMQFIAREAQGVFAELRQTLKDRAEEQYDLFIVLNASAMLKRPNSIAEALDG